jgi:hypothetical protein
LAISKIAPPPPPKKSKISNKLWRNILSNSKSAKSAKMQKKKRKIQKKFKKSKDFFEDLNLQKSEKIRKIQRFF